MGFYQLTDREVDTLNDWARTQPSLRAVFPYTDGRPGLGDRLNMLGRSGDGAGSLIIEETDGNPSFTSGAVKFNSEEFYLTADSSGIPVINSRGSSGGSGGVTDHGALTGLLDDDHPQYYKSGDVITAESFYLRSGGELTSDHGALTGLADDDHTQYLLASAATDRATFAANWTDLTDAGATTLHKHDHGGLDGLADDDHPQYLLRTETPPGFYGVYVRESDGDPPTFKTNTVIFDSAAFYLSPDSTGKPVVSFRPAAANGITDHGALTGLADDDHLQYALLNGARPFTDHVTFNDSAFFNNKVTAEAFYVIGGTRPPELNAVGLQVDDIRGFGDLTTTAGSRQINLRSPLLITPIARFNGVWASGGSVASQMVFSGAIDCSGQSVILGGAILDAQTLDNVNTAQGFTNAPTFQANTVWNEENVGAAHSVFQNAGMAAAHTLQINLNSALTAWPNNSGVHLTGMIAQPSVRRGTGITTGTLTVGDMAAFATNRSQGGFKGFFGQQAVGAGATVTDYSHYYAGSGGTDELLVTGTVTTEYGVKLNNLNKGTTRISLWSNSTTATMRHAGSVSIGKTTAPNAMLDVNGRVEIGGVGTQGTALGVVGNFYLQGSMVTSGVIQTGNLFVNANATIGNQLFLDPDGTSNLPSVTWSQFPLAPGIYPIKTGGFIDGFGFATGGGDEMMALGRDGLRVSDKVEAEAFYLSLGDISNEVPNAVVVGGTTVAFMPPRLTTTQRDALTPTAGMMIWNITTAGFQGYDGVSWKTFTIA